MDNAKAGHAGELGMRIVFIQNEEEYNRRLSNIYGIECGHIIFHIHHDIKGKMYYSCLNCNSLYDESFHKLGDYCKNSQGIQCM